MLPYNRTKIDRAALFTSYRAAQFATRRHQSTALTPLRPCAIGLAPTPEYTWNELLATIHKKWWLEGARRNSDAKLRVSPCCEARLQQIKLSDQLAGGLVGEPAGAGNTVDFGPLGTKPGQKQPPLDLIDLARR